MLCWVLFWLASHIAMPSMVFFDLWSYHFVCWDLFPTRTLLLVFDVVEWWRFFLSLWFSHPLSSNTFVFWPPFFFFPPQACRLNHFMWSYYVWYPTWVISPGGYTTAVLAYNNRVQLVVLQSLMMFVVGFCLVFSVVQTRRLLGPQHM